MYISPEDMAVVFFFVQSDSIFFSGNMMQAHIEKYQGSLSYHL